jgi:hypothetical protein
MANWFPLVLKPTARSWLMNLPTNSIGSWAGLCEQFVSMFQGSYKCMGTMNDIPNAEDAAAANTFPMNVCDAKMQ